MKQVAKDRALFHHRDSGGKAEMTPAQYVEWAQRKSKELKLSFDGTPERIEAMIREGRSIDGDLFVDYDVKGNLLSRTGLNGLIQEAASDPRVAAVLIPRRDRLARPDDPLDGIKLENAFQFAGKAVVYMDRTLPPLKKGSKADIAQLITALVDFDRAEKDRRDLAQKILYAQLRLATLGLSTGGRPPYGFRRWLVKDDGTRVRELAEGERVRMAGHHVVWLPTAEAELTVIRRILEMLETMPASQVAARLTAEGIPAPDAGRYRKDGGVRHQTSGVWHQTTVVSIARNKLLVAVVSYGLRSMGDKLRFAPEGPRELEESDFREDDKPKVVRNPESQRITAPARFEPLVDVNRHQRLLANLDARGATQRGKPRSHDPTKNPLGGRVFDINCGWPMYRVPYGPTFRYGCGFYQQSHGAECDHNYIDGPLATRFMLSCIQQRLASATLLPKMERRFREFAAKAKDSQEAEAATAKLRAELAELREELKTVSSNMSRAKTESQYNSISADFEELRVRETCLAARIADEESNLSHGGDAEAEVTAALGIVQRLTEVMADSGRLDLAGQAFQMTNARLFLRFHSVQVKNRLLNKVAEGVVTFGAAPDPIEIYRGPTGRRALKQSAAASTEPGNSSSSDSNVSCCSGVEDKSLGNVSRGERIRTSDLLVPNQQAPRRN